MWALFFCIGCMHKWFWRPLNRQYCWRISQDHWSCILGLRVCTAQCSRCLYKSFKWVYQYLNFIMRPNHQNCSMAWHVFVFPEYLNWIHSVVRGSEWCSPNWANSKMTNLVSSLANKNFQENYELASQDNDY
jgi:hypothetical protein